MIERLLIVVLVAALLIAGRRLLRYWHRRHFVRAADDTVLPELAPLLAAGRPTALAFSTPGCGECRSRQKPALEQLRSRLHDHVHIAQLSAPEYPTLVQHFGILTVPATVILDDGGAVHNINLGFADAERLYTQLSDLTQ